MGSPGAIHRVAIGGRMRGLADKVRCDSGSRHQSKFWSDDYLSDNGIEINPGLIDEMLQS